MNLKQIILFALIIFWIEAIFFFYSFFLDNNVFVSIEYKNRDTDYSSCRARKMFSFFR